MKNTLTYRGYIAHIEFDADDRLFFGRLVGIRDIVTFHGRTVDELESAFKEAVDHYLGPPVPKWENPRTSLIPDKIAARFYDSGCAADVAGGHQGGA